MKKKKSYILSLSIALGLSFGLTGCGGSVLEVLDTTYKELKQINNRNSNETIFTGETLYSVDKNKKCIKAPFDTLELKEHKHEVNYENHGNIWILHRRNSSDTILATTDKELCDNILVDTDKINKMSEEEQIELMNKNGILVKYITDPSEKVQLAAVNNTNNALKNISTPTQKTTMYVEQKNKPRYTRPLGYGDIDYCRQVALKARAYGATNAMQAYQNCLDSIKASLLVKGE
ncbi:hypothetical protein SMGD1_0260 [Sulfurimonas gotlandica GD1]|uniref:Lipoprotein n=1 Tax=Sulfurimonas gotlandica (strain DSM 19862 / JCM 16533 / GD1) TaxID=929558 RepID=B6BL50_SULGG|nr:hypothetical protein [Sulfurimonas gotlandica]EDZ62007.1 hypothetical protein CBGD1_2586 [Sulfurimonas gotlandica GD1]EHP28787.1 hypothetical protein SMGD1_0260 [Sulfurimonas gotlandica GD1]